MKLRISLLFAVLVVMSASLVQAQFVSPIQIIPVVAKVAGVGDSDWRSDLAISNLSDSATQVGINFYREETANSLSLLNFDRIVTIQAGETLQVEDVLGTWFPGEGNTKGFLVVVALGVLVDEGAGLAVSSRTYNAANPNATYGQGIPGAIISVLIGPGRIIMPGARNDSRFRSNVGVLNLGTQSADVVITVYDSSGSQVVQKTKNVKSLSLGQWSLSSLGVSTSLGGGRVEVRLAASALPADPCQYEIDLGLPVGVIMAYLSKADNATADAEFVLGQVDWSEYEAECGTTPDGC